MRTFKKNNDSRMGFKKKSVFGGRYFSNVVKLVSGSLISNAILFLSIPIITKLYSTAEFGEYSLIMSYALLLSIIISLRYEQVLPMLSDRHLEIMKYACLKIAIAMLIIFFLIVLIISSVFHVSEKYLYIPIIAFFCSTFEIYQYYSISKNKYNSIAYSKSCRSFFLVLSQYLLSIFPSFGLLLSEVISRLSSLAPFKPFKSFDSKKLSWNINSHNKLLTKYKSYPILVLPSSLLNISVTLLTPIFISSEYGVEYLGVYYMAYKIMSIPEIVLTQSISHSFIGEVSRFVSGDNVNILSVFNKTVFTMLFVSCFSYASLYFCSHFILDYVDSSWNKLPEFILVLIPLFISQTTMSSMYLPLALIGLKKYQIVWDVIRTSSILTSFYCSMIYDLDIFQFIIILGMIVLSFYFVLYFILRNGFLNYEKIN